MRWALVAKSLALGLGRAHDRAVRAFQLSRRSGLPGDAFRNLIERCYLQSVKYVKNAAADAERKRLQAVVELFRKYGAQYNLDYLLMAAQGYQESTLDHTVRSPVWRDWRDAGHASNR